MLPNEKRIKFAGVQFEINTDMTLNDRIAFQGEAEVSNTNDKSVGKDNDCIRIFTLSPLMVEVSKLEDGIVVKKEIAEPQSKSMSKKLRDVLYLYWDQQLRFKYDNFDVFYEAWMDSKIEKIKEMLE